MPGIRWRVDAQMRYDSVETGAPYYWTNVYFYENLSTDPFAGDQWNAIIDAIRTGTLDTVDRVAMRIWDTTHNTQHGIVTLAWNGIIDSDGQSGSLFNVARFVGWADGRQASYKLWRMPLRISDFDGSDITPATMAVIDAGPLAALNSAQFCNEDGVLIDNWTCDGRAHIWQLRHGTKRRERVVFAY